MDARATAYCQKYPCAIWQSSSATLWDKQDLPKVEHVYIHSHDALINKT